MDRVLGAVRIAKDEVGDAEQPPKRCLHQLRVGIEIAVPGRNDQVSLLGRHPCGTESLSALLHPGVGW